MMWINTLYCIFLIVRQVHSAMEGFVVGGDFTNINKYPHSVYLNIACKSSFICGGSILNQDIVLTAAHCLEECKGSKGEYVVVRYGHEKLENMKSTPMTSYSMHERYDEVSMENDICLLRMKQPIKLGKVVKRVILSKVPLPSEYGHIAGWGVVNKKNDLATMLKHIHQKLQPRNVCSLLGSIPRGSFCAGPITGHGNPDQGDSGSALVINEYVQIGIVSYKVARYSLVVYTNVSYYYKWIQTTSERLYCKGNKG